MYDYKLPAVCEQIFNGEIKKIALKAGITSLETKRETRGGKKLILTLPKYEMISSHTGRRSFATNFYEDGVTIRELMSVTGHTTEQAFKNYVKSKVETKFSTFLAVGANR
ncbi:MAG: tyrosine-type recombinase/integrase [Bacteroidia bacterium]